MTSNDKSLVSALPSRTAPFEEEPGYYQPASLWLYGNVRLLHQRLFYVEEALGAPTHSQRRFNLLEGRAEQAVLDGKVLVTGIHSPAHQRAAIVPLRWGSPRIVVLSGGFYHHLGENLNEEPFRTARLWRYEWDASVDLAVSRRAPDKLPTYASHNPTVDRVVRTLALGTHPGLSSPIDSLTAPISIA